MPKNDIYIDGQGAIGLSRTTSKRPVGVIDLVDFDPKHQRAEMGIIIMKAFRRQGYAQAAIEMLTDYSRNMLHLKQIYAVVDVDNEVSHHWPPINWFYRGRNTEGVDLLRRSL